MAEARNARSSWRCPRVSFHREESVPVSSYRDTCRSGARLVYMLQRGSSVVFGSGEVPIPLSRSGIGGSSVRLTELSGSASSPRLPAPRRSP